jgi:hypothetical protein
MNSVRLAGSFHLTAYPFKQKGLMDMLSNENATETVAHYSLGGGGGILYSK